MDFAPKDFILDGYIIIGDFHNPIALPINSSRKYRQFVFSAAKAYSMNYESIDYVRKKFSKNWFPDEGKVSTDLIKEIVDKSKLHQEYALEKAYQLKDLPDIFGLILAGAAIIKLKRSFQICGFLLMKGNFTEACCILKLILEQISWAYSVSTLDEENTLKVLPNKAISKLKILSLKLAIFMDI